MVRVGALGWRRPSVQRPSAAEPPALTAQPILMLDGSLESPGGGMMGFSFEKKFAENQLVFKKKP